MVYSISMEEIFKDLPNEKTCGFPLFIDDQPRFEWRGLMIDTARHYVAKEKILKTIQSFFLFFSSFFHHSLIN